MDTYFKIRDVVEVTKISHTNIRQKIWYLSKNYDIKIGLKLLDEKRAGSTVFTYSDIGKLLYSSDAGPGKRSKDYCPIPNNINYEEYLIKTHPHFYSEFEELKINRHKIELIL